MYSCVWLFDLNTLRWKKHKFDLPRALFFHDAVTTQVWTDAIRVDNQMKFKKRIGCEMSDFLSLSSGNVVIDKDI